MMEALMRRMLLLFMCSTAVSLSGQTPPSPGTLQGRGGGTSAVRQTQQDDYSQYELLAPETASFKILYEVSSTTAGATSYFNPIRKGSEASDEAVYDMMTGQPLEFEQVTGAEARAGGLSDADPGTSYIRVHLARPV